MGQHRAFIISRRKGRDILGGNPCRHKVGSHAQQKAKKGRRRCK